MSAEATQTPAATTETPAPGADASKPEITSMITPPAADGKSTSEAKPGETPPADDKQKVDDKPYAIAVPKEHEQYVDKAALEKFTALAKEAGITAEQASKVLAFDLERAAAAAQAQGETIKQDVAAQDAEWLGAIKKDAEMGGDKLAATQAGVDRFLTKFGDAQLRKDLHDLGMGNHPGLVRALSRAGTALAEDSGSLKGGSSAPKPPEREWIYD